MAEDKKKTRKRKAKPKAEVDAVPVSAPIKKPTDNRPSLAEAQKTLKEGLRARQSQATKPGKVLNTEEGLAYYYWDAMELADAYQAKLRLMFSERGYWKAEGGEYVPGVPHAEIWCTYEEIYKQIAADSTKRWEEKRKQLLRGR